MSHLRHQPLGRRYHQAALPLPLCPLLMGHPDPQAGDQHLMHLHLTTMKLRRQRKMVPQRDGGGGPEISKMVMFRSLEMLSARACLRALRLS